MAKKKLTLWVEEDLIKKAKKKALKGKSVSRSFEDWMSGTNV